jgi:hypothetical protein
MLPNVPAELAVTLGMNSVSRANCARFQDADCLLKLQTTVVLATTSHVDSILTW